MKSSILPSIRDRLIHLTETLHHLQDRVREAVATEMGRVVSEAIRDVLTTALRVRAEDPSHPRPDRRYRADPWSEDDTDDWDDDQQDPDSSPQRMPSPPAPPSSWATALSVGVLVAKWLWGHRVPPWPCVGVGVLATAATLHGGPVLRASLAALTAATDLVNRTRAHPVEIGGPVGIAKSGRGGERRCHTCKSSHLPDERVCGNDRVARHNDRSWPGRRAPASPVPDRGGGREFGGGSDALPAPTSRQCGPQRPGWRDLCPRTPSRRVATSLRSIVRFLDGLTARRTKRSE